MRKGSHVKESIQLAKRSLDGLSLGDAFGERFFGNPTEVWKRISERNLPEAPWQWTDDTAMARVIVAHLESAGEISPHSLSKKLGEEYLREPDRGYGEGAAKVLNKVSHGMSWMGAAGELFNGTGSKGNGGAMRAAPVGAYFAHDVEKVVEQATDATRVTHTHPQGIAGAVAVALATAWVVRNKPEDGSLFEFVIDNTPIGEVRRRLKIAQETSLEESPMKAAEILGNGGQIMAEDTVPYCLWSAARHLDDFKEAMWSTVSVLGDRDTTCAIVGGIIACRTGVPEDWLTRREPLKMERLK